MYVRRTSARGCPFLPQVWETSVRGGHSPALGGTAAAGDNGRRSPAPTESAENFVQELTCGGRQPWGRGSLITRPLCGRISGAISLASLALCGRICRCDALQGAFFRAAVDRRGSPSRLDDGSLAVSGLCRQRRSDQHLSSVADRA